MLQIWLCYIFTYKHTLLQNLTDNAISTVCDEIFYHFPLLDETFRHREFFLHTRHQSNTAKSAKTWTMIIEYCHEIMNPDSNTSGPFLHFMKMPASAKNCVSDVELFRYVIFYLGFSLFFKDLFSLRGRFPPLLWDFLLYPGTSAPEVWCATAEPSHFFLIETQLAVILNFKMINQALRCQWCYDVIYI